MKGASRKDRGLPEKAPPAPKKTAAMKRGSNGKGMFVEGMYDNLAKDGDVMSCCGCALGGMDEACECRCHEVSRMVARFKG